MLEKYFNDLFQCFQDVPNFMETVKTYIQLDAEDKRAEAQEERQQFIRHKMRGRK